MIRFTRTILAIAPLTLASLFAAAQGMIRGQVVDGAGVPLSGAVVTAHGPQGPLAAITNRDGFYQIAGMPGGDYDIQTRMAGYPSTLILQVRILGSRQLDLYCQISADQELYRVHTSPIESRNTYPVVRIVFDEPPESGS